MLEMLPAADDMFADVADVMCSVLAVTDWRDLDCRVLIAATVNAMPQRRIVEAEKMLLDVVCALWQRAVDARCNIEEMTELATVLMTCDHFVAVIKGAILSQDPDTSEKASKMIRAVCLQGPDISEQLCTSGVFDYIVESIREITLDDGNLSTEKRRRLSYAIHSVSAIVAQNPKCLPPKWCYCLDVIISACQHVCEENLAHLMTEVIGCAFNSAPVLVFTDETVDKFVAFEMVLFTKLCDETSEAYDKDGYNCTKGSSTAKDIIATGIKHLTKLFHRYQPSVDAMHSVLRICESFAQSRAHVPCVFDLLTRVVGHFGAFCLSPNTKPSTDISAVHHLGQRILFIIFDTWAGTLETTLRELSDPELMFECLADFRSFLDMLSTALNPFFVLSGCCSLQDRDGMSSWCWQYFPPNRVWHIFSELEGSKSQKLEGTKGMNHECPVSSMQMYLWRISSSKDVLDGSFSTHIDTNEESFLRSLACVQRTSEDTSMMILQRAIQLHAISGLSAPDLVSHALCARLQSLVAKKQESISSGILESMRGVAFMCVDCKLNFRLMNIPSEAVIQAMECEDFDISTLEDMNIFRETVLQAKRGRADVLGWDRLSTFYHSLNSQDHSHTEAVWTMLCENAHAVESLCYATMNSNYPQNIANFLLDMFDARGVDSNITKAFDKAGAAKILCRALERLPTLLSNTSPVADTGADVDSTRERARVTCFLQILSGVEFFSGAPPPWTLTRHICETVHYEAARKVKTSETFVFLSALLRGLIDSIELSRESKTITYLRQSGISTQLVQLLRLSQEASLFRDQTTSMAACLLVLILEGTSRGSGAASLIASFADFLTDLSCWERLLCSFPMTATGDRFCKVTNCCFLLDRILRSCHITKEGRHVLYSRRVIIPLTRAASSSDALLETASIQVLTTMMDIDFSSFYCHFTLTLFRMVCVRNLKKLCSAKREELSCTEFEFGRTSVSCGYGDGILNELKSCLQKMYPRDENDVSKSSTVMIPSEVSLLSREISNRHEYVQRNSNCASVKYCPASNFSKSAVRESSRGEGESFPLARTVQVLSGRYSVALTISSPSKNIALIS